MPELKTAAATPPSSAPPPYIQANDRPTRADVRSAVSLGAALIRVPGREADRRGGLCQGPFAVSRGLRPASSSTWWRVDGQHRVRQECLPLRGEFRRDCCGAL